MKTIRIVGISYALLSVVVAMTVTILQIQPATFFIELTASNGKFPMTLVFALTALLLLVPGFIFFVIISFLRRTKNVIPDLTGKTGIMLQRKRALYNAAYSFDVLIDGVKKGKVGNGQSLFMELTSGKHEVAIDGFKSSITEIDIKFGVVLRLKTQVKEEGIKANVIIVEDDLT